MEVTSVREGIESTETAQTASVPATQAVWRLRWLWLAWFGFAFCSLVIGTIGGIVQGDPARLVLSWGIVSDFTIFSIAVYVLGTGLAVLILRRLAAQRGLGWASFGLRGGLSGSALLQVLMGVVIASCLYILVDWACAGLGIGMEWRPRSVRLHLVTGVDYSLVVMFAVLLGPLVEELVFRGYVLTMFLGRNSRARAVLWSALIFTSVHLVIGPGTLVYIAFWSLIPAFLYLRHKSLYPAILFHVLNNAIAYLAVPMMGW
jgi:membrane protease YdiL (CAAX protease family)